MSAPDLIAMLGNLSQSLSSINNLFEGISYLLGLTFFISGIFKFKDMLSSGDGGGQQTAVATGYLLAGTGLFFLPSLIDAFSTTLFGSEDNVLEYSASNTYDIYSSMAMLIQTIGFIWFIRGCVLMAHGSHPDQGQSGKKSQGIKGLLFVIGGLLGINIYSTVNSIDYILTHLITAMNTI